MESISILVLCTGNSCRSQMAEGYLREMGNGQVKVYSAGIETHGLNPKAVEVMREDGIDISSHTSSSVERFLGKEFDHIITVCDHANESCPNFTGNAKRHHQNFADPAKAVGNETSVLNEFRAVRDQIKDYCTAFLEKHLI